MNKVRKEATLWIVVIFLLSMGIAKAEPKSNIVFEKVNGAVVTVTDFVNSEIDIPTFVLCKIQLKLFLTKIRNLSPFSLNSLTKSLAFLF